MQEPQNLRWTTQRDVCEALFQLLEWESCPINSTSSRRQLAWVLAILSDSACIPRWMSILLDTREDPWVRLRAREALFELGEGLPEEANAALLAEWFAAFQKERSPFPIQSQDLVTHLGLASEPLDFLPSIRAMATVHQGELLKDARLPEVIREPLLASWLESLQTDLSGLDAVWSMLDQASVRRWALASSAPLSPISVRNALRDASAEEIEAFFDGFPHRLAEAREAFCLPLAAMGMTTAQLLEAVHDCFRQNRGYRRVSPRSINACFLLDQAGESACHEAWGWEDIHPDLKRQWFPSRKTRNRHKSEEACIERASEATPEDVPRLQADLSRESAFERYYALEGFAEAGLVPDGLTELAEQDPHPIVRIQAAGLLARTDPRWRVFLRDHARNGHHVCERAEALWWLGELDREGNADILLAALDDWEPFEQYYLPAVSQAIEWVQDIPGDEAMTALLRLALRGPPLETCDILKEALRHRLGYCPAPRWRFVWRRLALRKRNLS